jgi:NADPH-dependent 2,4-dienoyl-CoA reductase/sulfur reductase-like enzyme
MEESFAVKDFIEKKTPRRAVIIGGGYIGLEMADALVQLGLEVTLLEFASEVLTTLDPDFGRLIHAELAARGVTVKTGAEVQEIALNQTDLCVRTASGLTVTADMVLVAAGARPTTELARTAGICLGAGNAVQVERTMATNVADIWAAGDGVQTWHRILKRYVYMPLGTTAHKQGRVAGENMLGGMREFQGSLGTQVVKVFGLVAARTGLREKEAAAAGFDPFTISLTTWDHKVYYPGAEELHLMITGDHNSGRLLGAQIVGRYKTEVSKRIDILAAALFHGMRVEDLSDLDLAYTPPLSSPWDPVQMVAMQWCVAVKNRRA